MTQVKMPRMAMIFGLALIVVGLAGFYLAASNGAKAGTALIPAIPGSLLLICGFLGRNEHLRKHAMHAAVGFAALSFVGSGSMVAKVVLTGVARSQLALAMQSLMFLLSAGFVILAIVSFIHARRANGDAQVAATEG